MATRPVAPSSIPPLNLNFQFVDVGGYLTPTAIRALQDIFLVIQGAGGLLDLSVDTQQPNVGAVSSLQGEIDALYAQIALLPATLRSEIIGYIRAAVEEASLLAPPRPVIGTIAAQNADNVAITGGSIDGATIGGTTAAAGTFSGLTLTTSSGSVFGTVEAHSDTGTQVGQFAGLKSRGTKSSKTGVQTSDRLFAFFVAGYTDAAAYGSNSGAFLFSARENFTSSALGTQLTIELSKTGATARTTVATFTGDGVAVTGFVSATQYVKPGSFTVATVPSAATAGAGAIIYVSNETGGAVIAFSDGANWKRVTDRANIS
jgi:hypothetical protein